MSAGTNSGMRAGTGAGTRADRRAALWVVLAGTFMGGLDAYIVNLSLPAIGRTLGADVAAVQWVPLAYLGAITGLVVACGRAADLYGAGRVYAAGLAAFTLASALAGLAPGLAWLVAARAAQGAGAAAILAAGQAIVAERFGAERGRALAWLHVAVSAGFAAGPTLGGVLVERAGWRSVFFVNVVPGLAALAVARRALPPGERRPGERLDVGAAAALTVGLVALLLGLTWGQREWWALPAAVAALVSGGVLLAAFVVAQRRAPQPIMDPALFRSWPFTAGLAAAFLTFVAMASNMFLIPFLLQESLGLPPGTAGLVMVIVPLAIVCVAPLAGRLADRVGPRLPATAGLALVAAAVLALYGAGAGLFQAPNNSAVLGAVPARRRGVAAGTLTTVRQLGQVAGIAVAGGLLVGRRDAYAAAAPPDLALALGFRDAFAVLAAVAVGAALVSWLRGPATPASAPPAVAAPGPAAAGAEVQARTAALDTAAPEAQAGRP